MREKIVLFVFAVFFISCILGLAGSAVLDDGVLRDMCQRMFAGCLICAVLAAQLKSKNGQK